MIPLGLCNINLWPSTRLHYLLCKVMEILQYCANPSKCESKFVSNGDTFWWLSAIQYIPRNMHRFFALLCFVVVILTDFPISIRLTSLALWQSNDCPSASKATLMNMDKYFMWIHYERLHNHNKAKHNKTVCIFLGIYCTSVTPVLRHWSYCNLALSHQIHLHRSFNITPGTVKQGFLRSDLEYTTWYCAIYLLGYISLAWRYIMVSLVCMHTRYHSLSLKQVKCETCATEVEPSSVWPVNHEIDNRRKKRYGHQMQNVQLWSRGKVQIANS